MWFTNEPTHEQVPKRSCGLHTRRTSHLALFLLLFRDGCNIQISAGWNGTGQREKRETRWAGEESDDEEVMQLREPHHAPVVEAAESTPAHARIPSHVHSVIGCCQKYKKKNKTKTKKTRRFSRPYIKANASKRNNIITCECNFRVFTDLLIYF